MSKKASTTLRFKTSGYSANEGLSVDPGPCRCGDMVGVAFWHDDQGAWLISYDDLAAIADAAQKARAKAEGR